jgi:hypothetical protein
MKMFSLMLVFLVKAPLRVLATSLVGLVGSER